MSIRLALAVGPNSTCRITNEIGGTQFLQDTDIEQGTGNPLCYVRTTTPSRTAGLAAGNHRTGALEERSDKKQISYHGERELR
jgi:hypothetical protein